MIYYLFKKDFFDYVLRAQVGSSRKLRTYSQNFPGFITEAGISYQAVDDEIELHLTEIIFDDVDMTSLPTTHEMVPFGLLTPRVLPKILDFEICTATKYRVRTVTACTVRMTKQQHEYL